MALDDHMIAALKRERAGYVARGEDDRIRQVDEQLAHYGHTPGPDEQDGPQGRTAPPQQTTDRGKPPVKKTAAKKTAAAPPAE